MNATKKNTVQILREFSIPLIAGVAAALLVANLWPKQYDAIVHASILPIASRDAGLKESKHDNELVHDDGGRHAASHDGQSGIKDAQGHHGHGGRNGDANHAGAAHDDGQIEAGHAEDNHGDSHSHGLSLHFLVNDLFMVIFFGIAAKEITESCLPGGALNPPSKAINPLMATVGGVLGPVAVFFGLNATMGSPAWANGWGIPTATDIALAWLIARMVFGKGHPAVSFLLLLAVADDAIGLGIIAFAYPDPHNPTVWTNTLWIVPAMGLAFGLRRLNVRSWLPYVAVGGLAWWGLYSAHLHPALALVFIVPFMPGPQRDLGLYIDRIAGADGHKMRSPLEDFEHQVKPFVDFGLFFFAFANAGVPVAGVTNLTWIIFAALLIGKTIGITGMSIAGAKMGFPMPNGMTTKHVVVTAVVAGIGLTVALFVSAQAYTDIAVQGAAKMGALLSGAIALFAIVLGKVLAVKDFGTAGAASRTTDSDAFANEPEFAGTTEKNELEPVH